LLYPSCEFRPFSQTQKVSAILSLASTYKFTIDKRPDPWYRCLCYLGQTQLVSLVAPDLNLVV